MSSLNSPSTPSIGRFFDLNERVFVIENVPARVNEETGEQLFSPRTVERLQQIILAE